MLLANLSKFACSLKTEDYHHFLRVNAIKSDCIHGVDIRVVLNFITLRLAIEELNTNVITRHRVLIFCQIALFFQANLNLFFVSLEIYNFN